MRAANSYNESLITAVKLEDFVPAKHPLRKRIEQCFGWGKLIGPIPQVTVQGLDKVDKLLTVTMAACNLTRLRTLAQLRPQCAQ